MKRSIETLARRSQESIHAKKVLTASVLLACTAGATGAAFRCSTYKGVLEASNVFFAIVFLFELLVKLIGLGVLKYMSR